MGDAWEFLLRCRVHIVRKAKSADARLVSRFALSHPFDYIEMFYNPKDATVPAAMCHR